MFQGFSPGDVNRASTGAQHPNTWTCELSSHGTYSPPYRIYLVKDPETGKRQQLHEEARGARQAAKEIARRTGARLRPRFRMVMLRKEGGSCREIAERTGLTATSVRYLIHQAMKTLKVRLEDLREDLS